MKYRIEATLDIANESDAQAILSQVNSIKANTYAVTGSEPIALFRLCEYGNADENGNQIDTISSVTF